MSISTKQSVPEIKNAGSKTAFSLILSALFLTVVLGSPAISLAQVKVTAKNQKPAASTAATTDCAANKDQAAAGGHCSQTTEAESDDSEDGVQSQAAAKKIYSNLGPAGDLFDPSNGWLISGPNSGQQQQAIALPFTPKTDINLEGIELPVGWYGGLNSVNVCIYADFGGLPGEVVECVTMYNMYPFGGGFYYPNCVWELPRPFYPWPCVCLNVWEWNPFLLTHKVRYWVSVYPDPYEPDFYGGWYWNYKDATGPFAYFDGTQWNAANDVLPAVELFGK
jgi:hypothetical protein